MLQKKGTDHKDQVVVFCHERIWGAGQLSSDDLRIKQLVDGIDWESRHLISPCQAAFEFLPLVAEGMGTEVPRGSGIAIFFGGQRVGCE